MPTTAYMNLDLPVVSSTLGPEYATMNNEAFTAVDSHNHTTGQGVPIPTDGIGINADLTFGSYNAIDLRTTRYTAQAGALVGVTDLGCLYVAGVDLYYNDGDGNNIQLTANGALNAASIGGIGGDYATSDASVAYSASTKTFTFLQDTNQSALMDIGTILLRRTDITSSAATTIQANGSLTVGYTLTLPSALPAATGPVMVSNAGALSFLAAPNATELGYIAGLSSAIQTQINSIRLPRPSFKSIVADSSQLIIPASSAKPAIVKIGSAFYTNVTDYTLDLDTGGVGGLDTGAKAANTAYYVYAVLPASGTTFRACVSAADPNTGPTGFSTNWTYLGSFRTVASSVVPNFSYCNGRFNFSNVVSEFTAGESTPTSKTFVGSAVASTVYFLVQWSTVNASGDDCNAGPASTNLRAVSNAGASASVTQFVFVDIPLLTANTVYTECTSSSDSVAFKVVGWNENPSEWQ